MIEKYWLELEQDFDNIVLHDFAIMPNHFHGIIEIKDNNKNCNCKICRDTPCGYPNTNKYTYNIQKNYFGIDEKNINKKLENNIKNSNQYVNQDTHKGCPYNRNLLGNIIGGFKSKTINNYIKNVYDNNWNIFNKKLWQKGFYEHIIGDEKSYFKIIEYINNNVSKWEEDKFYYTEV